MTETYLHGKDDNIAISPGAAFVLHLANASWLTAFIVSELDDLPLDRDTRRRIRWEVTSYVSGCSKIVATDYARGQTSAHRLEDDRYLPWPMLTIVAETAGEDWTVFLEFEEFYDGPC